MQKKMRFLAICFLFVFALSLFSIALAEGLTEEDIIAIAQDELDGRGIVYEEATILYDGANERWEEFGKVVEMSPADPNYGNLPHGVLSNKKYNTVYFDFVDDDENDIWVFVDPDEGEVLAVYVRE